MPLWPPGQGAYLLLLALCIGGLLLCYFSLQQYRANHYRRTGLALLDSATTVHDVSVVLKRVALAAFPREHVAPLYGNEWMDFLRQTCPGCEPAGLAGYPGDKADSKLIHTAGLWIRKHTVHVKG